MRGRPVGRALLALGGNLPPREAWLDLGAEVLAEQGVTILATTPRWNTRAIGSPPQPDFLNQLLLVEGARSGLGWLELAQALELRAQRHREVAHGPRTLDVDVILIEGESWDSAELSVPHPGLLRRPYLLRGAALLVPEWTHPGELRTISELARAGLHGSWAWIDRGRDVSA
ncbi:MAG: 2-amino-4-hydroxy-6-hydroxymethyldihydropteridine diphosphokinase [Candidatus Dormibacteria bacterium]